MRLPKPAEVEAAVSRITNPDNLDPLTVALMQSEKFQELAKTVATDGTPLGALLLGVALGRGVDVIIEQTEELQRLYDA